jgi:SAM-dependent methyltransferase
VAPLKINIPFCIGATDGPNNPADLPSTLAFEVGINYSTGAIQQKLPPDTEQYLLKSYQIGLSLGTPSDDNELGKPYVDDFIDYIRQANIRNKNVLEIGCGTGYVSRRMLDLGANVTSLEPGKGYEKSWKKYGLDVINDFFPTSKINTKFDLIIFYTVFEHISNVSAFLNNIKKHLCFDGKVILSVPDCSDELRLGDPSILMHEHVHYFNKKSLTTLLGINQFNANVKKSKFGRSLYATAKIDEGLKIENDMLINEILKFEEALTGMECRLREYSVIINNLIDKASLGVYIPARALNYLPANRKMRFFDDASYLLGKYFPPFHCRIESRDNLLHDPTEILFIASRTFGSKLKNELITGGFSGEILTLTEMDQLLI